MSGQEKERFQLQEYYDILMSPSNLKEKLKPFVRQFKKKKIPFIYETLVNTMQVLTGKHEIPLMKYNALMATKLFFDTAEYVPNVLIEIYLLPIVFEIALYRIQKRSQEGLTLYFTEKGGYDSTKQMKRLGFNFVLLAIEFIFMSAKVKPYRCLQNQELREDSNYTKMVQRLQEKGLLAIENYNFYIPSYVAQTRKKYLKRLTKFKAQQYTDYFLKLICDQINLNKKPELDIRKLFSFGDAYITIPLMHVCEDELSNMENNFVNKKKYLILLGDFMKYGDIYAVLIITRSSFLESIFQKVQKAKGEMSLDAGESIYPEVEASRSDKKNFYVQFLKHIQIWANCHPVDQEGEATDAKKIFDILKGRKFVFPSNILINKIKAQMQENLKINQKRNQRLIKLVDQHSQEDSKRKLNSSIKDSKISKHSQGLKVNSYIQFDQLQEIVLNAKKKLDLINDQSTLTATINALQKFRSFWQGNAEKNQVEADESGDIEIVLQQGDLCVKIIEMVVHVYQLYSKGAISFEEYKDRVSLLMKKQAQDSVKQTSFEQIPKSESLEKFDDCYQKSSLSQLQSNVKRSQISLKGNSKISQKVNKQQSGLKQNDFQPQINSDLMSKKELGNVSFREESNAFSQEFQRISKKESPISSSLPKQQSFRKKKTLTLRPEPQIISEKVPVLHEQSMQQSESRLKRSGSISSNRSRSNRRLKLENQGSKVSMKSQSVISSASAQYKDVIGKGKLNYQEYYNQSNESFISSQQIIQLKKKKAALIKPEYSRQIQLYAPQPKSQANYQDYFGKIKSKLNKNKQSGLPIDTYKVNDPSELSKKSSQLQSREEYRENNYTQSILSYRSKQQSKSQSKISVYGSKEQKILVPSNFSRLAKYQQEESVIAEPQFQPLLHSFHTQKSELTKVGSFRDCFEVNNEIILAKEGKEKLLKFTKTGKIANFIENAYPKQTLRNSTIVDIISQRNAKRSIDSYRHLRQKSRATESLSQRMKSLQSFNKNMRIKMLIKNQESKQQMSNKYGGNKVALKSSRFNGSEPVSFYNDTQSQHSEVPLRSEAGQAGVSLELLNISRMINPKIYSHYFPTNKSDKLRKCMLKSKSLLLKDTQFQIGFVTNRTEKGLQVSLFLTPLADTIQDVRLSLMNDHNLKARLFVQMIDHIKMDQQECVNLQFQVENVPFVLPTLNLKFKKNKNFTHNQMLVSIPISFNKFATYHPLKQIQVFPHQDSISLQQFPYYPKLLSSDRIKQSLTNFELIGKQNRLSYYGCEAYFKGKIFTLRFAIGGKGTILLEGRNMSGDHKNTKFLQFLLVTFRQIFQCPKKDDNK